MKVGVCDPVVVVWYPGPAITITPPTADEARRVTLRAPRWPGCSALPQLAGGDGHQTRQRAFDRRQDIVNRTMRVPVGTTQRFRHDLIDDAEAQQIFAGETQARRGFFGLSGIAPQDRRAPLG